MENIITKINELINPVFILNLQIFSCFFMTGVIWIIQLVHYPSFRFVEFKQFFNFQKFHTSTITFIVGPVMVLEIFSALHLLIINDFSVFWMIQAIALIIIWLCTAFLSVPLHTLLSQPHTSDAERLQIVQVLVRTNWPRTILWTFRSLLFIVYYKGIS